MTDGAHHFPLWNFAARKVKTLNSCVHDSITYLYRHGPARSQTFRKGGGVSVLVRGMHVPEPSFVQRSKKRTQEILDKVE